MTVMDLPVSPEPDQQAKEAAATTIEKYARAKAAKLIPSVAPESEVAPLSEATKAGPSRWQNGLRGASFASKTSPAAAMHALSAIGTMKLASEMSQAAIKAREERERQKRMDDAALSFDELFAQRERDQAVAALSDIGMLKYDLKRVRLRLKRSDRMLLSNDGWFVKIWDILTLFALLYTVFVTPYEIGFLSPETASLVLEVGNYVMLVIFTGGMVVSTSHQNPCPRARYPQP